MGQTEVTQEAYQKVTGKNPSYFRGAKLPVDSIIWNDARSYCEAVGAKPFSLRLPTEAEFEYAARAGSKQSRYGEISAIAWYQGNSGSRTHEVAQKAANAWGLYDTLGNVWEWTSDWYADRLPSAANDPTGPPVGQYRALRGGSGFDMFSKEDVRASVRLGIGESYRNQKFAFVMRCSFHQGPGGRQRAESLGEIYRDRRHRSARGRIGASRGSVEAGDRPIKSVTG